MGIPTGNQTQQGSASRSNRLKIGRYLLTQTSVTYSQTDLTTGALQALERNRNPGPCFGKGALEEAELPEVTSFGVRDRSAPKNLAIFFLGEAQS